MIKEYYKKHQNNECLVIVMYHVSNRILKKNFSISEVWVFSLFCEF